MKLIAEAIPRMLADEPEVSELLGECVSADPEKEIPLQAADLICWHLQCKYRGGFSRADENRMWCLLNSRDVDLHEWTKEVLDDFAVPFGAV